MRCMQTSRRVAIPQNLTKNQKKKMTGANIDYRKVSPRTRKELDKSRRAEWKKWQDFGAPVVIQQEILAELLDAGHSLMPSQWV